MNHAARVRTQTGNDGHGHPTFKVYELGVFASKAEAKEAGDDYKAKDKGTKENWTFETKDAVTGLYDEPLQTHPPVKESKDAAAVHQGGEDAPKAKRARK